MQHVVVMCYISQCTIQSGIARSTIAPGGCAELHMLTIIYIESTTPCEQQDVSSTTKSVQILQIPIMHVLLP